MLIVTFLIYLLLKNLIFFQSSFINVIKFFKFQQKSYIIKNV